MSRIITFYSYKGGVGRTFALANIGVLLAKRGKRVLLMDWDLEAPGLDRYFRDFAEFPSDRGLVHLLHEAKTDPSADWHKHSVTLSLEAKNLSTAATYTLTLIPSGVAATDYAEQVRDFGWAEFFASQQGGPILERWRQEWKKEFDFILLDSRTGITDAGGVCTILLPDFLALVFTANEQSFEGACASCRVRKNNVRHWPCSAHPWRCCLCSVASTAATKWICQHYGCSAWQKP